MTFEVQTLTGYPRPRDGMENVFDILTLDGYGLNSDDAGYGFVQQLLPGEEQDGSKLEMGRSYEQVDTGVVERRARGAEPTEREIKLTESVGGGSELKRKGLIEKCVYVNGETTNSFHFFHGSFTPLLHPHQIPSFALSLP